MRATSATSRIGLAVAALAFLLGACEEPTPDPDAGAASDAGRYISDRSIQLHGGIGFTWECDVHIYFKRSMHNQALYGDGVHQRKKLADQLIGPIA